MPPAPDDLVDAVVDLSRLMVLEDTREAALERILDITCRVVGGCDSASVTLVEDGRAATAAALSEDAPLIDEAQYRSGRGPCLAAYEERTVYRLDSVDDERFPEFAQAATGRGIRSSMSLPLTVGDSALGALNLYSRADANFDVEDATALLLSRQAAAALLNAEIHWRATTLTRQLETALETRDVIGQAKGILMATRGITADQAFELLRDTSQRLNVKLREIADRLVLTGELP